jgi:hypothetical protein
MISTEISQPISLPAVLPFVQEKFSRAARPWTSFFIQGSRVCKEHMAIDV